MRTRNLLPVLMLALAGPVACADDSAPEVWRALTVAQAASVEQGWREACTDAAVGGGPLRIAGRTYARGLGTHAPGVMVFPLEGRHRRFAAEVGVDDGGDERGSVVFKVLVDGREAFDSGVVKRGQAAKTVALDVTGAAELKLIVSDAGDGPGGDHADWAEARVDDVILPRPVPQFSTAGFFSVANGQRKVWNFNPGWRFLKADAPGAEQPGFDDSAWEAAHLPHGLEILGENASGGRNYQGPAWYRKRFDAAPAGGRTFLYFEAVMGRCGVWVNGQKLAEHFGGYLPFAVDIGAALNPDGRGNIVAVRADNSDDPSYPPGKPQGQLDFAYLGGIYRDVYLLRLPAVHVTLPESSPTVAGGGVWVGVHSVRDGEAAIEVRTELANASAARRSVLLRTVVETADGLVLKRAERPLDLPAGGRQGIVQPFTLRDARPWHPDDPCLHYVRTEIVEDGFVGDALRTRFGIRLFEMRGKDGLFVNGRPIGGKLSGVNRHQDHAFVGNALPNSGQWRDAKLLREGGCAMVRAAHYPLDPAFYDACDEFGLLATTANPGWQFFNERDPAFERRLLEDTRALVRRDRNRPSLLLWETALNETPGQPDRALQGMHRAAHEEYPFPGFFTVADVDEAKRGGLDFHYHGGFDTPVNSQTREYGDGGEVDNFFSHNATTRVKREWGEGPLLAQAAIRARDLAGVYGTPPQRIGATLWCGIDHQRGYHPDPFWGGLLDGARVPCYAWFLFKSQYGPEFKLPGLATGPMVKIAHELTQVSGADVIVYSNCEEVRLTWLGQAVGTQKPDAGYGALPHPPLTFRNVFDFGIIKRDWRDRTGKIEMLAEGLIGGRVVASECKRYAERTAGLSVVIDDAGVGLVADGSDFVPVRAVVVDQKGVPKVLAAEYVTFEVEGSGEIVGGPATQTNPARTEFGTATALLRAGTRAGVIRVRASAPGLAAGEAYIASVASTLPLACDAAYAGASRPAGASPAAAPAESAAAGGGDARLKEEIRRLQAALTGKEQEIMELRSTRGKRGE